MFNFIVNFNQTSHKVPLDFIWFVITKVVQIIFSVAMMSTVQTLYLKSFSLSLHSSSSMEYKKTLVVLENPVQLNCANFSTYLCKLRETFINVPQPPKPFYFFIVI